MSDADEIIAAIQRGDLAAYADRLRHGPGPFVDWAAAAHETCRRIASQVDDARRELRTAAAGLRLEPAHVHGAQQRHELWFTADQATARLAIERFRVLGFVPRIPTSPGGLRSFWATADEVAATRSGEHTTVVRIRWRTNPTGRRHRLLRPSAPDWDLIDLPGPLWRLYPAVRVVRLALERVGLLSRDHGAIEPFLVTPDGLIEPLLDVADVGSADVVADLGCGDGRLLIGAAARRGCRAIGAEYDSTLAATARERAVAAGVADRITILEGDGLAIPFDQVTVLLLFLPTGVLRRVLPIALDRLPPGGRVVAHEQAPLPDGLPQPDRSVPIVAAAGVTVAHLWVARRSADRETPSPSPT